MTDKKKLTKVQEELIDSTKASPLRTMRRARIMASQNGLRAVKSRLSRHKGMNRYYLVKK